LPLTAGTLQTGSYFHFLPWRAHIGAVIGKHTTTVPSASQFISQHLVNSRHK